VKRAAPGFVQKEEVAPNGRNKLNMRTIRVIARFQRCDVLDYSFPGAALRLPLAITFRAFGASYSSLITFCLPHSLDNYAGRRAFDEWQTNCTAAGRFHFLAPVNFIERVVPAFDKHVG
jgi:hypothetical protein